VAIRQEAGGRRQEGRKKVARLEGIITVYPFLDISYSPKAISSKRKSDRLWQKS